jgi:hypothetical protein
VEEVARRWLAVNTLVKGRGGARHRVDPERAGEDFRRDQRPAKGGDVENAPSEGSQLDEQPEAVTEEAAPVSEATDEESIESGLDETAEEEESESPQEGSES